MAAAIAMALPMCVTSCTDKDDDNTTSENNAVELEETPTEDALSVTTDKSYVLFGDYDDEFGKALGRRLRGTMTSSIDADIFVVDPVAVNKMNAMDTEELKTLIQRTESGEASVVLTQTTFREFYDWAQIYVMGYLLLELENYYGDHGYDSPAAAPARRKMANIVRNAYMASQPQTAQTRATTVNGTELDWEHVNTWPEEQQNAVMFDGFAQCGGNELFIMNAASTLDAEAEAQQPQNDYEWGNKADAMADWLNHQGKEDAQTRADLKSFAQAVTRAGNADISDLMSAQTKDFVFDYQYQGKVHSKIETIHSALKAQYTAYSAYDFGDNIEYYQVRQRITAMNNKIFTAYTSSWIARYGDGDYNNARGAWMKRIDTKMWLAGKGTKVIMSAGPLNENGTSSGSTSAGGSSSVTTGSSDGYSIGISTGASVGLTGPSISLSASYNESHTNSYSKSSGLTWGTSTSWSTKDLTTTYTEGTDANKTVSWKHNGHTPTTKDQTSADWVPQLLKGTCQTDEQVLWKVQNPSGVYTLKASFNVVNETVKMKGWDYSTHVFVTQDNKHDISFELNTPDRYKMKWNNVIYDYGTAPEGMSQLQYTSYLDNFIEESYGNNSACFCWARLFTSTEATANGSDNACAVFQTFKNSITGMKIQLYQKGFRGQIVFGLKRDGSSTLIDQIMIDLDNIYTEGETLKEEVNGYTLSFKVTKTNEEVQLKSVPSNFTGELVIPEQIGVGIHLKVTSLGNTCAYKRTGITSVTIPTTVQSIYYSALGRLTVKSLTIPEGVTYLGQYSCSTNSELAKLYLPSTLTEIAKYAFWNCDGITEIHIKATTPPTVAYKGLNPAYKNATLYVPKGCKDAYASASYWKDFVQEIVEE